MVEGFFNVATDAWIVYRPRHQHMKIIFCVFECFLGSAVEIGKGAHQKKNLNCIEACLA